MSAELPVIGWDVGGAHLKRAVLDPSGRLLFVDMAPCPLWQGLARLDAALAAFPPMAGRNRITMTGELTDLWPDRASGVKGLAEALAARLGSDALFYAGPEGFLPAAAAAVRWEAVASANWHATAAALALVRPAGILVDMGSTTTDIIAFSHGAARARGYADWERLVSGELVYTGLVRTPVMALAPHLPFRGDLVPLMAEHFATTADIYRLTGALPEEADLHPAADGGPKTREASARRLLRMVGRDLGPCTLAEAEALAADAAAAQLRQLAAALSRVIAAADLPADARLIGAGVGRAVARRLADRLARPFEDAGTLLAGGEDLAAPAANCAPAVAVARLGARSAG